MAIDGVSLRFDERAEHLIVESLANILMIFFVKHTNFSPSSIVASKIAVCVCLFACVLF